MNVTFKKCHIVRNQHLTIEVADSSDVVERRSDVRLFVEKIDGENVTILVIVLHDEVIAPCEMPAIEFDVNILD